MPKGFELAEFNDFNYLYDNELFEVENYPVEYFVRNWSKKNIKKGWGACRLYRSRYGYWNANWNGLDYSNADGRVDFVCGEATAKNLEASVLANINDSVQKELNALNERIASTQRIAIETLRG